MFTEMPVLTQPSGGSSYSNSFGMVFVHTTNGTSMRYYTGVVSLSDGTVTETTGTVSLSGNQGRYWTTFNIQLTSSVSADVRSTGQSEATYFYVDVKVDGTVVDTITVTPNPAVSNLGYGYTAPVYFVV